MAIKCHSGFQHYHMFHNSCGHGGGNNYGSIFNITHNCGGGTNFWGGLGAGLGYGLGGMFSGLLGGFMGGFGNMFGGFGMNMFGGFGNMFGGFSLGLGGWGFGGGLSGLFGGAGDGCKCDKHDRYERYSSKRGNENKDTKFEDPDNKEIIELRDKIRASNVTAEQLADYVNELNELKSKGLTDNYKHDKDVEELGIDALIAEANKQIEKLNNAQKPEAKATGKFKDENIDDLTVNDIADISETDYNNLNDADKKLLQEKVYNLTSDRTKALEWAKSTRLPSDLRAEAKRSFYEEGYKNAKIEDMDDEALKNLVAVIDTSSITDFTVNNVTEINRDDNGKITSFKIKATTGTEVTYHEVAVVDGELIFHGKQDNQEYAVQKGSDNNYRLMQYEYHKGWGSPDVTKQQQ